MGVGLMCKEHLELKEVEKCLKDHLEKYFEAQ
jgi:hypothetical protein